MVLSMLMWLLWFDVGIKRYTMEPDAGGRGRGCGLMQESKDIQWSDFVPYSPISCGLMQESKDIQFKIGKLVKYRSCGLMQESKDIQYNVRALQKEIVVV